MRPAGILAFALIAFAVACKQPARPSLKEEEQALDRVLQNRIEEVREGPAADKANATFDRRRRLPPPVQMNAAAIDELEKKVAEDPGNLDLRLQLLFIYEKPMARGELQLKFMLARRRHILWLITNYPEDELAGSPAAIIRTRETSFTTADPEGYTEAKQLWFSQLENKPINVAILANAANAFEIDDNHLAGQLLEQARIVQPNRRLTAQLARVYVLALVGATAAIPVSTGYSYNIAVQGNDTALTNDVFANEIRRKLDASRDDELLQDVGADLLQGRDLSKDFDYKALGRHYLTRAATLNPGSNARRILANAFSEDQTRIRQERIRQLPKDNRYEAAAALPDKDRFDLFWLLALNAANYGNSFDSLHPAEAKQEWLKAEKYATDLIAVAPKFRREPAYPLAIFNANMLLAQIAARTNDIDRAVQYLRAAAQAPKLPDDIRWPNIGYRGLCNILIARGRQKDVVDFLEHVAMIDSLQRDPVLAVTAQLRQGQKPSWYGF
ncbi:MAG TPA: hypothetical protein VGK48_25690 [Terriglobia bacterium]|jgi:hypothetical protein